MVPAWHLALARPHVLRGGSRDNQVSQRGINHVAAAFANAPLASSGSRRKQVDGGHRALLGPLHQDRLGPATSAVAETTAVKQDGRTRHAPMQGAVVCWPRPGGSGVQPQLARSATHAAHSSRTQRDATHAARRPQRGVRSATNAARRTLPRRSRTRLTRDLARCLGGGARRAHPSAGCCRWLLIAAAVQRRGLDQAGRGCSRRSPPRRRRTRLTRDLARCLGGGARRAHPSAGCCRRLLIVAAV